MRIGRFFAIACLALVLVGCKKAEKPKAPAPKLAKVFVVSAPITRNIRSFPGKVEASTRVKISFQVGGRIAKFPVVEGQELKKGAFIAALDAKDFNYAIDNAQAKYNLTQSQEKRYKALVKDGYVAKADYDQRKSDFDVAAANLKKVKKDLKDATIDAPFDGMVIKKYVKLHQQIKPNEHIVNFQDIDQIDVRVSLPENVIVGIKKDKQRELKVSFEAQPGKSYVAKVKEFSAEADPETQTFDVILTMPAPKKVNILPGMTATIKIELPVSHSNMNPHFKVPSAAVFKHENGKISVWLVNPKTQTVSVHSVTTGTLSGTTIEIISGLKPGDELVSAGVHFLRQGETIKPLKGDQ